MARGMSVNDLVLVQGMRDTKLALGRWNDDPIAVLRPWAVLSTLISVGCCWPSTWSRSSPRPDPTRYHIPG